MNLLKWKNDEAHLSKGPCYQTLDHWTSVIMQQMYLINNQQLHKLR